jgi:UDP-N-acetylglucosamine 3-dehydrogenase
MKDITVAVFGYGRMGKIHCRALSKMPHVSRIIVIDTDQIARTEALQESRKIVVYSDLNDSLKCESIIDYITVSTPSKLHFDHISACMEFNLNILIEKPFVTDISTGFQLLDKINRYESTIGVGFIERYNSSIRKAREIIKNGTIGKPLEIHTRRWGLMPMKPDIGVSLDLASHDVDTCRFLLGQEYAHVFARMAGSIQNLETTAIISGLSTEGTLILNSVNWTGTSKLRETIVIGEVGSLRIDTSFSELTLYKQSESIVGYEGLQFILGEKSITATTIDHPKIEPIISEHLSFQSALIDGDLNKIVTIDDAYRSLMVIDAAHRSQDLKLPIII